MTSSEDDFIQFAEAASARLRRTAYLLCGDWHTAEDLTQTTLAKMYVAWRRISRRDAVNAYAARTLLNTYLADCRKQRGREMLTGQPPEQATEPPPTELRLAVLAALQTLPARARAIVVLRYWADQSVDQVAAIVGCSPGNVKSQSARALARLRPLLADAVDDLQAGNGATRTPAPAAPGGGDTGTAPEALPRGVWEARLG